VAQWSLTTLREKLVKIGARIVRHGRYTGPTHEINRRSSGPCRCCPKRRTCACP
jgi:hypothetical protein